MKNFFRARFESQSATDEASISLVWASGSCSARRDEYRKSNLQITSCIGYTLKTASERVVRPENEISFKAT